MKKKIGLILFTCLSITYTLSAQESVFQQEYRKQVLDYNQDIKVAQQNAGMHSEYRKVAKSDFKPKLIGGANFNYTGNPYEISLNSPTTGNNMSFEGQHMNYGVGLSLEQSIYAGGSLQGQLDAAKYKQSIATNNLDRTINAVLFEADVKYWQVIAQNEMVDVARSYVNSVKKLEEVARHRVEVDYADKNDLLMTEVKLNDANYQLLRAQNSAQISTLALYSFANIDQSVNIALDDFVIALKDQPQLDSDVIGLVSKRPEILMANDQINLEKSNKKISKSKYRPQFSIGIDGSYSSPGYNFKTDMDFNYAVYAKLSVPIFEWGKGKSTSRAHDYSIQMATQQKSKLEDNINLEIRSAYYNYSQSIDQVKLTENSLLKAKESEDLTLDRYKEGTVSIVEVLNSQLYHQQAQINYIQSKLNAQIAKSEFERTTLSYKL